MQQLWQDVLTSSRFEETYSTESLLLVLVILEIHL